LDVLSLVRLLLVLTLPALAAPDVSRIPPAIQLRDARVRRSLLNLRGPSSLEARRDWDRLGYFAPPGQAFPGVGLFGAAVVAAAHSPVRVLFDGKWHLGPALLEGYGLGIGFGGRM
jgi:hypothetical protein